MIARILSVVKHAFLCLKCYTRCTHILDMFEAKLKVVTHIPDKPTHTPHIHTSIPNINTFHLDLTWVHGI